jgi:all-trans-retinol 13,14-reductase
MIGQKFSDDLVENTFDLVIIGSGISGLTLANIQAKTGKKVLVLEKHYIAGGFTHTYKKKGFEWDTGLHYIGDVHREGHPIRLLFDYISGGKLKWAKMPEDYDEFHFPGEIFTARAGKEAFVENLVRSFPTERKNIEAYITLIKKVTKDFEKNNVFKLLPEFMNFSREEVHFSKTTYEVLKSITNNEKLISVLVAIWGDYGLPPKKSSFGVHALIANHYLEGASFPIGGSSEIARSVVAEIEKYDGKVVISCGVKKILIKDHSAYGVELENGHKIYGHKIVSSAGVHNTFLHLVDKEHLPESFFSKVESLVPSSGYFSLTLGLNKPSEILNHLGGNIWKYPGFDHDENVKKYLSAPFDAVPPMNYISFPSLKDPTWKQRMGQKTSIDVLGILPFEWVKKWEGTVRKQRPQEYQDFKEEIARPYFKVLFELFPQIEGKIDFYEISTPLTVRHFVNYIHGELYGLNLEPNRFKESWLKPKTPIKNLYLTGQDIMMNGVAGAMVSAVLTSTAMNPVATLGQMVPLGVLKDVS